MPNTEIIDYEKAAGDVNKWDMQFDDEHEGVTP